MRGANLLLMVLGCVFASMSFGQTQPDYLPDGTQGEYLEVLPSDSVPKKWRDKRWRLFPGKITTLKLGGGFLYEFATFAPDRIMVQQMDSISAVLEPTFKVRDFRIVASGQFKTKRKITWKAGLMYDGPSRSWLVRETGLMIEVPELSGHFFIGRTKEGFSLNKVMNGYAGWTLERQMALDVIPILADGIKSMGFLPKQKILWNMGVYADWLSKSQSFSTFHWQLATRVGWLPVYFPEEKKLLHVGISYRYGEPAEQEIRVRSRPEANPAPYFVDTGNFSSKYANQWGGEVYFSSGPLMVGSEIYSHTFATGEGSNSRFIGGEVVISYIFTGESRPYNPSIGIYTFVPVDRPLFKGGPGVFEGIVRMSALDLSDGPISGGSVWRITPMLNWYLTKDVRLEIAYGYAVLNRFELQGTAHIFQTRLQLTLL